MVRILRHPGVLVFAGILGVLLLASRHFYFLTPLHELGDIALNAIQIDRAKSFGELYGNYSRFFFHHPGPGIFYVYALAELLLCDLIPTGLPPHAVHSLAGLALQAGFFALALHLASGWVRHRLFLPLVLLVAAVHFTAAGYAFVSIWPPHVLLMPFVAFLVAGVSVAAGRIQHLPWVALAGSFLVHGHVAQPLFVVTMTLAAYACLWGRRDAGGTRLCPWQRSARAHWISFGVIALFVLPLAIDLTLGQESNFAAILRHLEVGGSGIKKPLKSLLYFLSYFAYRTDQETLFHHLSWDSARFLREQAGPVLLWLGTLGVVVAGVSIRRWPLNAEKRRFVTTGTGGWLLTMALCLIWGMVQTGPMTDFNGYFYYGVAFVLALLAVSLLVALLPSGGRWVNAAAVVLVAGAGAVAWHGIRYPEFAEESTGMDVPRDTAAALRADPRPDAPKVLVFAHRDWPVAASIALALRRANTPFLVDGTWTFMFEHDHELPVVALADPQAPLSVWRILQRPRHGEGVPFRDQVSVVFEPDRLPAAGGTIDCGENGNLERHVLAGFTTPDAEWAWTCRNDAALQFRPEPATHDVELAFDADPFLPPGLIAAQQLEVRFNGEKLATFSLVAKTDLRVRVPRELWNRLPVALLHFHLPSARSPAQLKINGDPRILGFSVRRITTAAAP